jgi:hypothetical protein
MSPDPSDFALSRRRVLSSAAAVGTLSAAGCTTTLPPLGQRVRFGRIDFPPSEPPTYRTWVPTRPSPDDDAPVRSALPGRLPTGSLGRGLFVAPSDYFGTDFETYDRAVAVAGAYVFEGDTDPETVAAALDGTGYDPAGRYEGYDLYDRTDTPRMVAATDGAVLWAAGPHRRRAIERVADTGSGRRSRRHETDDDFAAITDAAGANGFVAIDGLEIGLDATSDALTTATTHAYRDSTAYFRSQYRFETEAAVPDPRQVRRELRAEETAVRADAADVRVEGRRLAVEIRSEREPVGWRTPQITWGADHDADAGTVTLRHEAGDAVDADDVAVTVREVGTDPGLLGTPEGRQFADASDTVAPGDSLTRSVGDTTRSVYVTFRPTEKRSSRLFTYELP